MKTKNYTKKDFKEFKNECNRLIKIFQLNDWSVVFKMKDLGNSYAEIIKNYSGRTATITLDKEKPKKFDLKKIALHEILHLFIANLSELGKSRYVTEDELFVTEESLIIKLESILYKKI